jgi:hypothetical protein
MEAAGSHSTAGPGTDENRKSIDLVGNNESRTLKEVSLGVIVCLWVNRRRRLDWVIRNEITKCLNLETLFSWLVLHFQRML